MKFAHPIFLLLAPLLLWLWWWVAKKQTPPTLQYGDLSELTTLRDRTFERLDKSRPWLYALTILFMLIALARPQTVNTKHISSTQGVDIILAFDTSASMLAEDFKPKNRLAEAKKVLNHFIDSRQHDRLGLVVFGTDAYTQCPLTTDYDLLHHMINYTYIGMAGDGTAIGMGIATALNRLKCSKTKNKLIILMTDGENNSGEISPYKAADLAHSMGIKIYTIGIGKIGGAPIPYKDPAFGMTYVQNPDGSLYLPQLDEQTLKTIAKKTNALYFRATDSRSFNHIYDQINALEKSDIESLSSVRYTDWFMPFLCASLFCFLASFCLEHIINKYP